MFVKSGAWFQGAMDVVTFDSRCEAGAQQEFGIVGSREDAASTCNAVIFRGSGDSFAGARMCCKYLQVEALLKKSSDTEIDTTAMSVEKSWSFS